MQIEVDGNGGSQLPSRSDSGQTLALTRDYSPEDRTYRLQFLNEVQDPVLTGRELLSKENRYVKLAIYNSRGQIVKSGPGSNARVDVVVLEANDNVDEDNMTRETFESRIIKREEKKKPHFVKHVHIYLKEGVGNLTDAKFGHHGYTKICMCRLGAKMGPNLNGFKVQEAWTPPFKVRDKRVIYKAKHHHLNLDSEVWRLDGIARDGALHKRLKGKKVESLRDFLFWFHVNPEGLKQILRLGGSCNLNWKKIVDHAKTCTPDRKMYSHKSSNEPQMSVVYDAGGELKGVIDGSHFVPIDNLSADRKDDAHKLLMSVLEPSAFDHRYDTFFHGEASLLHQFPLTDPQNFCGAAPVDAGPENRSLLLEELETNAGASENGMEDFWKSIDHMEIPWDATSLQHYLTIHDLDDLFSLVDPPNFCAVNPSDFELPVEDNLFGTDDFGGIGDENEQLPAACPIGFRARSAKRWRVMLAVQLSIMRIRIRVVRDTRKRKR